MSPSFDGLSILMVGDVYINRSRPASIFRRTGALLRDADVTLVNLEGVIGDADLPPLPGKVEAGSGGHLLMPLGAEKGLTEVGVDMVAISNNHSMDYGEEGLRQTIRALERAGIAHGGAGENIEEAHLPCFVERKGLRVALLAYTSVYVPVSFPATENKPGAAVISISTAYEAPYNVAYQPGVPPRVITYANAEHKERLLADIRQTRAEADILVVSFHWGLTSRGIARSLKLPVELCPCFVLNYQEDLARLAIDAGADIIWGHHPHELQGIEIYKGKIICYSLGNFAFDHKGWVRSIELDSAIVQCNLDTNKNWSYSYIPVRQKSWQNKEPDLPGAKERKRIVDLVSFHSQKYGTTFREEPDTVLICGPEG